MVFSFKKIAILEYSKKKPDSTQFFLDILPYNMEN